MAMLRKVVIAAKAQKGHLISIMSEILREDNEYQIISY